MTRKFDEKFANLINHNTPRTFMQNPDADISDIPIECSALKTDELPKPPTDGFIATYCSEDGR